MYGLRSLVRSSRAASSGECAVSNWCGSIKWRTHHVASVHQFDQVSRLPGVRANSVAKESPAVVPSATPEEPGSPQNVLEALRSRDLVQDVTSEELGQLSASQQLTAYVGFDPTADALHLGNLLGIIVLSWFQRCGHRGIALLGGATGRVGDPSGKSAERPVLSAKDIEKNVSGIGGLISGILERNQGELTPVKVVNNFDWYRDMTFLDFLRDVGKFARMGTMLNKDSVKTRLAGDVGMSFTEFSYQLLQGYDFVHLLREHGVRVQVGGSDQWGNITAGTDLIGKLEEDAPDCFGLTFPLLVDSEGKKIGKSEGGGAAWLAADKLSPYKFYQYLFKTEDADVIRFLRMLTFLPLDRIEDMEKSMAQEDYVPNTAQTLLAEEVTRFVHGEEGVQAAKRTTAALKPGAETKLDAQMLEDIAGDAPSVELTKEQALQGMMEVMVAAGLQPSKSAARRMIKNGGVYKNNAKVASIEDQVSEDDLIDGRLLLLAAGKKNKLIVRISQ